MSEQIKIGLAADHGGFDLKVAILNHLKGKEIDVVDYGTDNRDISVDYPDFAKRAVLGILNKEVDRCIIICGTGIGISIAANRYKGIRAALCSDTYSAKMSRLHNDANILALGGRVIGVDLAKEIVDTWLAYEFEGGRHKRRIDKIEDVPREYY